ncbi:unnamed protein product [Symbiodinium pilosum]|uniref:NADH:ubiquinone oxidoreductase intermediate-associated protein 30 domain-containing protein n=1 Tax=Symbiodinium pilosum TaxID=2952 RepID=A0A812NT00_SYMPI|nr:unnamed protein product [Symbiodinium pilosum]
MAWWGPVSFVLVLVQRADAFHVVDASPRRPQLRTPNPNLWPLKAVGEAAEDGSGSLHVPLFRFSDSGCAALDQFERIDDVIMGGVSKSSLSPDSNGAAWRGLVRTEGGGFCGQRTRPKPFHVQLRGCSFMHIRNLHCILL